MYNIVLQEGSVVQCSRAQILELAAHCLGSVLASLKTFILVPRVNWLLVPRKIGLREPLDVGKTFSSSRLTSTGH